MRHTYVSALYFPVILPVWGPPTTTESRLFVPSPGLTEALLGSKKLPPALVPPHAAAPTASLQDLRCATDTNSTTAEIRAAIYAANDGEVARVLWQSSAASQTSDSARPSGSNDCTSVSVDRASRLGVAALASSADHSFATATWDNRVYTEQMFYFNTNTRVRAYWSLGDCTDAMLMGAQDELASPPIGGRKRHRESSPATADGSTILAALKREPSGGDVSRSRGAEVDRGQPSAGLDHCFDCSTEIAILRSFLLHVWPQLSRDSSDVCSAICSLSGAISTAISPLSGRSLATSLPPASIRFPCHVSLLTPVYLCHLLCHAALCPFPSALLHAGVRH